MTNRVTIFKMLSLPGAALAAAMLWGAPAQANLNCPSGQEEYNGQCWAPVGTQPSQPPANVTATGGSSSSTATGVGTGTASIGNVGGGSATATNGPINVSNGPITSTSGVRGSGNSRNDNRNQQGQQQGQSISGSGNSSISIRQQVAAAQAAPVLLPGYGPPNCMGDTNPSGQFGMSWQALLWGVNGNSMKASNFCAVLAIGGPVEAMRYLQRMDPNVRGPIVMQQPTGRVYDANTGQQISGPAPATQQQATCTLANGRIAACAPQNRSAEQAMRQMQQSVPAKRRGIDTCALNPSKC